MKELLTLIFQGWIAHEASWDATSETYTKSEEDAMIEACGGDSIKGQLLVLFSHWGNDVESLAAYYGLQLKRDENNKLYIGEEVPPPPSPQHWWHGGQWLGLPSEGEVSEPTDSHYRYSEGG